MLANKERLLNRHKEVQIPKEWSFYLETVEVIRARKTAGYLKKSQNAKLIKVIGDSHTSIFDAYTGSEFIFDQTRVHGATARGSANPKTKTNSLEQFRNGLKGPKAKKVIIGLGEVDCGYIIWWRNAFKNETIEKALTDSMDGMFNFIQSEILQIYEPKDVIIMSVIPPVIEDNTNPNFLEGRRAEVNPSIEDRYELTVKWNNVLAERCNKLGYTCININSEITDSNNRVLNKYRNPNALNHHLWEYSTLDVVLNKLKDYV